MKSLSIEEAGCSPGRRVGLFAIFSTVVVCARFSLRLMHAELWAEDGTIFYPNAYYSGIHCLLWPLGGYLNTVQRLGALLAVWTHLPLLWLPTFFAIFSLSIQSAVAVYLVSSRFDSLWPHWGSRAVFAFLYLALPNSYETFGVLTNSQWNLAILAFLVVVTPPQSSRAWRVFDMSVLLVSGLSGPFGVVLFPFCLLTLWRHRTDPAAKAELWTRTIVLGLAVATQLHFLISLHGSRKVGALGATPWLFARIVASQVIMGLLLGFRTLASIRGARWLQPEWPQILIASAGLVLAMLAFLRGSYLLRVFCVYSAALFTAELSSPVVSVDRPQWPDLVVPFVGERYYVMPMLAFAAILFTLAALGRRVERTAAIVLLTAIFCWSVPRDFLYLRFERTDYDAIARRFDHDPPGARERFPEYPKGVLWMVLVKKAE